MPFRYKLYPYGRNREDGGDDIGYDDRRQEAEEAAEEKADREFDRIYQGDCECCVCGAPSYMMLRHQIYCKHHYDQRRAEIQNKEKEGK